MASLPVISGRDAVKVFGKLGFAFHRQKGSHVILYHP
ncbi:MAG: type II toxin-antitoxin system HicA family toxin, partial [Candidatus Binatia bacterium]